MPNEIEVVVTSKDKTDLSGPTKAAEKYGSAMGGIGDKVDASEGKLIGAVDTISGVQAIMAGPGEDGIAAYIQGWADLAGGMAAFVIPTLQMLGKQMLTQVANAAKFAASTVATAAKVVASWIMMGVQAMASAARMAIAWVIAMGPVILVIAAIAAVIAIIVLLVKNWDKVKAKTIEVAKAIGQWMQNAAKWVVNAFVSLVKFVAGLPATMARILMRLFSAMPTAFGAAWTAVSGAFVRFVGWVAGWHLAVAKRVVSLFMAIPGAFGKAWTAVSEAFVRFVGWVAGWQLSIANRVGNAFSALVSAFGKAWSSLGEAVGRFLGWVAGLPGSIANRMSGAWDGLTGGFRSAINWIIDKWNNLSFGIPGVDTHIPGIGKIGGFTLNTPNIPRLAKGAIVRATPGGSIVNVGEGGRDEAVVPLPAGFGMGGGPIVLELRSSGSRVDDLLLRILRDAIQVKGGNVQVVLGS